MNRLHSTTAAETSTKVAARRRSAGPPPERPDQGDLFADAQPAIKIPITPSLDSQHEETPTSR